MHVRAIINNRNDLRNIYIYIGMYVYLYELLKNDTATPLPRSSANG